MHKWEGEEEEEEAGKNPLLVTIHRTTQCHNVQDSIPNFHCYENLKAHIYFSPCFQSDISVERLKIKNIY
jgi:hypothetical protein